MSFVKNVVVNKKCFKKYINEYIFIYLDLYLYLYLYFNRYIIIIKKPYYTTFFNIFSLFLQSGKKGYYPTA